MNRKRSKQIHLEQPEMGMKKGTDEMYANPFAELFWMVNNIPVEARELICKQCDWSVPTFYRKLRSITRPQSTGKVRGVSSAELASIKAIYVRVFEETLTGLKAVDITSSK
ncbi:hypothetical protein [Chitinophaga sp.]|uniref:hypothetical protein n=1 Tax=Chitinophaga sp. TaxID=1869181 RepID=UPI0031DC9C5C